ncbi:hypothetical protein NFI96_011315 [Prochilodus magdalenae]|nr:hypothetical protein NFI96_011315 [Prochilodus magdalenae]
MSQVALPVAVPGTLYFMSGTAFAASDATESGPSLVVDELSLYTTPCSPVRNVEPEVGHVEQGVAALRKTAEPYTTWCQVNVIPHLPHERCDSSFGDHCWEKTAYVLEKGKEFYKTIEPGVDSSLKTVKEYPIFLSHIDFRCITISDTYELLNDPPSELYPSVGAVGFSGILGLYLAKGKCGQRSDIHLGFTGTHTFGGSVEGKTICQGGGEATGSWFLANEVVM